MLVRSIRCALSGRCSTLESDMDFLKSRDYAFLSQASYRNLTALLRGADARALEASLTDDRAGVPSPQNRFAELQAKQLTGSATGSDPSFSTTWT
mgnify:CR=1 FL=1